MQIFVKTLYWTAWEIPLLTFLYSLYKISASHCLSRPATYLKDHSVGTTLCAVCVGVCVATSVFKSYAGIDEESCLKPTFTDGQSSFFF
jgi:hypothetical protein